VQKLQILWILSMPGELIGFKRMVCKLTKKPHQKSLIDNDHKRNLYRNDVCNDTVGDVAYDVAGYMLLVMRGR
jgi:hypothetical protein